MPKHVKRIIAKSPEHGYYWQVYENGKLAIQSGGDFETEEKCKENFKWIFKVMESSLLNKWGE